MCQAIRGAHVGSGTLRPARFCPCARSAHGARARPPPLQCEGGMHPRPRDAARRWPWPVGAAARRLPGTARAQPAGERAAAAALRRAVLTQPRDPVARSGRVMAAHTMRTPSTRGGSLRRSAQRACTSPSRGTRLSAGAPSRTSRCTARCCRAPGTRCRASSLRVYKAAAGAGVAGGAPARAHCCAREAYLSTRCAMASALKAYQPVVDLAGACSRLGLGSMAWPTGHALQSIA